MNENNENEIIDVDSFETTEQKTYNPNPNTSNPAGVNKYSVPPKEKKKSSKGGSKAVIAGTLVFGLALGSALTLTTMRDSIIDEAVAQSTQNGTNNSSVAVSSTSDKTVEKTVSDMSNSSTANVISAVKPAVVSIGILGNTFDDKIVGAGTGVVFKTDDEKAYIVTNNHVINGAAGVQVWFEGIENPVSAKLVGTEPSNDIAVISVTLDDLKNIGLTDVVTCEFGDSDDLEVGDSVIAIGNAMGEGISSTGGMISMKEKTITDGNNELNVIQTDASINPGNSGGPLVNSNGQVIGINTAKLVQTYDTAIEGVGYAVPSNDVIEVIDNIMNKSDKAYLGIKGSTIDARMAELFSIPEMGVLVRAVDEGGSAYSSGIKVNDIITSFDGQTVTDISTLQEIISDTEVGSTVPVIVLRNGEKVKVDVTMQKHQDTSFN